MKRAACLSVLVSILGLGACSHGLPQGWVVSKSQHVNVYTDTWIEHEYMQEWLELSHLAYQALFPNVKTGRVDAVWLREEPGGFRFYGLFDDPQSGWTLETMPSRGQIGRGGLIVLQRREQMVPSGPTFTVSSTRDERLAKSQMAHLFIMKAVPSAPLWLQVGLARYMSRFRIHHRGDGNRAMACFGSAVFDEPIRPDGVRTGRRVAISIAELATTDWYGYDKKRRYWYEYTAYAMVHYLIHGERGFHKTRFPVLLQAVAQGQSTADALATAYPHILADEWDERVDAYMRPKEGPARMAENPYLQQGMCFKIPSLKEAERKPDRTPANAYEVEVMLDDLDRVDPFRRHSSWFPTAVVEAEAAKRPPGPRSRRPGPGTADPGPDPHTVPTIRTPSQ